MHRSGFSSMPLRMSRAGGGYLNNPVRAVSAGVHWGKGYNHAELSVDDLQPSASEYTQSKPSLLNALVSTISNHLNTTFSDVTRILSEPW